MRATARRSRRIRVLHAIQNLNYGGMERLLADIVVGVDPTRVENHVLCLGYLGRFAEGLEEHARLHQGPPLPRYSMLWPGPLVAQLQAIAPDVVHTHSGVWYKVSLAAKLAGVKRTVHTEHGRQYPDPWQARLVDRLAARRTETVVAVSELLTKQLVERRIARRDQITLIRNGVDTEEYRPRPDSGAIRRELGIAAETPIVGSIGRTEPIKGTDIMLEAFAELWHAWPQDRGSRPVLVVGGEGSLRERLLARAADLHVGGAVHLLGWRDDVHDLQSAFTLFTLSSRSEGTSISLLQAMSAGLCPVVTDVGGNAAVLGEVLAHRLVPAEDPRALAAAWREALFDPGRRHADGVVARRRALAEFSLSIMVGQYQQLYLGRPSRRAAPPEPVPLHASTRATDHLPAGYHL